MRVAEDHVLFEFSKVFQNEKEKKRKWENEEEKLYKLCST